MSEEAVQPSFNILGICSEHEIIDNSGWSVVCDRTTRSRTTYEVLHEVGTTYVLLMIRSDC